MKAISAVSILGGTCEYSINTIALIIVDNNDNNRANNNNISQHGMKASKCEIFPPKVYRFLQFA